MTVRPSRRDAVPMKSGRSRLAFFPGCSLEGTGREYGESTLAVLKALGREVSVLEDWNCCGAAAVRDVDRRLFVGLCARNLTLAARQNCDLLVACAACYNNMAFSRGHLADHPEDWTDTQRTARPETVNVYHLLTVLTEQEVIDHLRENIVRPLVDVKLACYYGCLLVRPDTYVNIDDPENPQLMDGLMKVCGARTIDWSYKTDCCGGSFALTRKDIMVDLVARIFEAALAQEVTGLVTACPLCQMNLDAWQSAVRKQTGRTFSLPVYHFTELLALAMDLPEVPKWLSRHVTDARGALKR